MFYTYKITINNKIYIGYTGQTVEQRFHKHKINALAGLDTHLYRAMRKYGIENAIVEEISSYDTMEEATKAEKQLIVTYGTIKNGMNMAPGGSGGNTRVGMSDEKYATYCKNMSLATTGPKNPNYSGYTDDKLIQFGIDIVNEHGYFSTGLWLKVAADKKLPKNFSKNRFGGSFNNFRAELQKHFDFDITYKVNDVHRENLSKAFRKYSNDELLDFGIKLVKENGCFIKDIWVNEYSELYGTPKSFSGNTFNGSFVEFRKQIASKMGVDLDTIIDPFQFKHRKNREKYRNSQNKKIKK